MERPITPCLAAVALAAMAAHARTRGLRRHGQSNHGQSNQSGPARFSRESFSRRSTPLPARKISRRDRSCPPMLARASSPEALFRCSVAADVSNFEDLRCLLRPLRLSRPARVAPAARTMIVVGDTTPAPPHLRRQKRSCVRVTRRMRSERLITSYRPFSQRIGRRASGLLPASGRRMRSGLDSRS